MTHEQLRSDLAEAQIGREQASAAAVWLVVENGALRKALRIAVNQIRAHGTPEDAAITEALAATPETAAAELAELWKDKERLDWLDDNMTYRGGGNGGVYSFSTPADVESGMLRTAIDAARVATRETAGEKRIIMDCTFSRVPDLSALTARASQQPKEDGK